MVQQINQKEKTVYPSEVIALPSRGWFYGPESKLSLGTIEMKYMSAKDEDILTSKNLIQKGVVIDRLIESLILDKSINTNELLIGDKNALMIAARILGYGSKYDFSVKCSNCGETIKDSLNLSDLPNKDVDFDNMTRGLNEFEFKLPASKKTLKYKFLTVQDEKIIEDNAKSLKKITKNSGSEKEVTSRLAQMVISIDGESDRKLIVQEIENMLALDSKAFRDHLQKTVPDIELTYNFECTSCGHSENRTMPIDVNFFWPGGRL